MEKILIKRFKSPVGDMVAGSFGGKLCLCDWVSSRRRDANDRMLKTHLCAEFEEGLSAVVESAIEQLEQYFSGNRKCFDIPLIMAGTEFQRSVWMQLMEIPYGGVVSYSRIARGVGNPKAVRAVAAAIGANPISIIVPCHRVIGSDGSLTGYAGGLHAKKYLLTLEDYDLEANCNCSEFHFAL